MPELTVDVFGNYVIQKFFEFGAPQHPPGPSHPPCWSWTTVAL